MRFVAQAFQNCHAPLEAPDAYVEKYPEDWRDDRRWYAGMVSYWVRINIRSFQRPPCSSLKPLRCRMRLWGT